MPAHQRGTRAHGKRLRLFVDGLLEVGDLEPQERGMIEARMTGSAGAWRCFTQATTLLSGCRAAPDCVTTKQDAPLKHVEFVHVVPARRW